MANLTLPGSPSDGDTVTHEGTKFTYNATAGRWTRELLSSRIETVVPSTNTSVTATAISGNNLVFTQADGSTANVDLSALSGGQVTTYANESDLPSDADNGSHGYVTATTFLYVKATTGWYKITSVNLTPAVTVGSSTISLTEEAQTIDVTYTVAEPEDTPVTITVSNTGISNTDQVTITHTEGNNTISVLSGNTVLSGGTITISASDGINIGTGTISVDLSLGLWSSYSSEIIVGSSGTGGDPINYGVRTNIVANGLNFIAFASSRRDANNVQSMGGFDYWVNTSGNTSNNTSWSIANSYYHLPFSSGQGFSHSYTGIYGQVWGDKLSFINSDGSKIAWGYEPPGSSEQSGKLAMYIVERNSSNGELTDYHSFNPYDMISTAAKGNRQQFNWGSRGLHYGAFSDNLDRLCLTWPRDMPTFGISHGSHVIICYVRDSVTNVWSVEKEFLSGDYSSTSARGGYGAPTRRFMGAGNNRLSATPNLDKIVAGNSSYGGMVTLLRSGSTWTAPTSGAQWGNPDGTGYTNDMWGTTLSMSSDGNYLAMRGNANSSLDTEKIYVYQWNNSNTSWDDFDNWQIKDDGSPYTFGVGDYTSVIKTSGDGEYIYVQTNQTANGYNAIGRFYKKDGSSYTLANSFNASTLIDNNEIDRSVVVGQKDPALANNGTVFISGDPISTSANNHGGAVWIVSSN